VGFFELFTGLLAGLYAAIPSYGLAIILLVVVVRLVVLPLSIKSTRSMREMQLIQPEVKKIQAKYKGDRQKMNEALMALYKEHGVNPFGGCLPTVLQIGLIIPLYWVIRQPLEYMEPVKDSALAHALRETPLQVYHFLGIRLDCSSSAAWAGQDPSTVGELCGTGFVSALPYLVIVALVGFTAF
jgi:YidC/Oxa1 family membrane protein insertase